MIAFVRVDLPLGTEDDYAVQRQLLRSAMEHAVRTCSPLAGCHVATVTLSPSPVYPRRAREAAT